MIPSHPLRFSEIAHETMKIFGRSLGKNLLLVLIFFVPACIILNVGAEHLIRSSINVAVTTMGFSQKDLDVKREQLRREMRKNNPENFDQIYGKDTLASRSTNTIDTIHRQDSSSLRTTIKDSNTTAKDSTFLDSAVTAKVNNDSVQVSIGNNVVSTFSIRELFAQHMPQLLNGVLLSIAGWFLLAISQSLLYAGISDAACYEFEERKATFGAILKNLVRKNLWKSLGLFFIIFVGTSIAADLLGSLASYVSESLGNTVYFVAQFARFYLIIRWSMAIPAAISEEITIIEALNRSWHLTTFQIMRVFGIGLLFFIGLCGLMILLAIPISIIEGLSAFQWIIDLIGNTPMTIPEFTKGITDFVFWALLLLEILTGFSLLVSPIFNTVFYYDLRTRLDGPLSYRGNTIEEQIL